MACILVGLQLARARQSLDAGSSNSRQGAAHADQIQIAKQARNHYTTRVVLRTDEKRSTARADVLEVCRAGEFPALALPTVHVSVHAPLAVGRTRPTHRSPSSIVVRAGLRGGGGISVRWQRAVHAAAGLPRPGDWCPLCTDTAAVIGARVSKRGGSCGASSFRADQRAWTTELAQQQRHSVSWQQRKLCRTCTDRCLPASYLLREGKRGARQQVME